MMVTAPTSASSTPWAAQGETGHGVPSSRVKARTASIFIDAALSLLVRGVVACTCCTSFVVHKHGIAAELPLANHIPWPGGADTSDE